MNRSVGRKADGTARILRLTGACLLAAVLFPCFAREVLAERIEIVGAGPCEGVVTLLAEAFMQGHSAHIVAVPPSVGSAGGIKRVGEGEAVLARVTPPPHPQEQRRYGNLTYEPFARSALVFATHAEERFETLSSTQVRDILTGTITNWKELGGNDRYIRVFVRQPSDSSFDLIARGFPGIIPETITPKAKVVLYAEEMERGLEERRGSFGWVAHDSYLAKRLSLNIVHIDGILPTPGNIASGTYPMVMEYGFVYKGKLPKWAGDFVTFVTSDAGAEVMRRVGLVPILPRKR